MVAGVFPNGRNRKTRFHTPDRRSSNPPKSATPEMIGASLAGAIAKPWRAAEDRH